jgi:P-type Ca2+ transporter type 2C
MYVEGAPEILLEQCSLIVTDATNQVVATKALSDYQDLLVHIIQGYSNRSLRMIGFAHRDFPCWPPPDVETLEIDRTQAVFEDIMKDLTFLGIFAIQDPLRPGGQTVISRCRNVGVNGKCENDHWRQYGNC